MIVKVGKKYAKVTFFYQNAPFSSKAPLECYSLTQLTVNSIKCPRFD